MKNLGLWLSLLAAIALVGCGDDGGRTGDDGGTDDDGGIILMDSGPESDSGSGGDDSGSGGDDGGSTSCTPATVPAPSGGVCSAETQSCIEDASTQDEFNACLDSASMDCVGCLNQEFLSCATMNGCDGEWGCVQECAMANGCMDQACLEANCSSELDTFISCAQGLPMGTCGITDLCFM